MSVANSLLAPPPPHFHQAEHAELEELTKELVYNIFYCILLYCIAI